MIHRLGPVLAILVAVAMVLPISHPAWAGEHHTGSDVTCQSCHVMHGSYNGTSYNSGSGFPNLLKYGTTNEACLSCHNGGATSHTPDVVVDGKTTDTTAVPTDVGLNSTAYTDPYRNSAGFFLGDWNTAASKYGHDLYATAPVQAVQGTWTSPHNGMTCADCHAVHGNGNWRNLKARPGTGGVDVNVTAATSGATADVLMEGDLETEGSPDHYQTDRVRFNENNHVAQWCEDCHTDIAAGTKHPQNVSLAAASDPTDVDVANWTTGSRGFEGTVDDGNGTGAFGVPRVRFAQSGSTYAACGAVSDTNQVFCLTCHKAHGSKYDSALVWPHFKLGSGTSAYSAIDRGAACQQCHNRGA